MRPSTPTRTLFRTLSATTLAAGALALAACGGGSGSGSGSGGSTAAGAAGPAGTAAPAATSSPVLKTWSSPLGEIVVTASGRAVYAFDPDKAGAPTSACTGTCAHLWPAVTTTSTAAPQVSGVTGAVGTAPGGGGTQQLTLDGHRLYTYAGDGPGQVSGQGVQHIWWVLTPSGSEIRTTAAAPSSSDDGGYSY